MKKCLFLVMVLCFFGQWVVAQDESDNKAQTSNLKLDISVDRSSAKIGEFVYVDCKLTNNGKEPVDIYGLELESRSIRFDIVFQDPKAPIQFSYTRVRPDIYLRDRVALTSVKLGAGQSVNTIFAIPLVKVCNMEMMAEYTGSGSELKSNKLVIEVKADGANQHLGVEIKSSEGGLVFPLHADESPNSVMHFATLVNKGFYNGLSFHRLVKGFVVHTGCPYENGTGGPGYSVEGEHERATTKHEMGAVSLSLYENNGYTGSQFFISLAKLPNLDKKYTILGKITDQSSLDVLKKFNSPTLRVNAQTEKPEVKISISMVVLKTVK